MQDMQDEHSSPPPRRSFIPLCSGIVGMMLGGLALALFFEHFRDLFGPNANIWQAATVGTFSGFCTGFIVGRKVAAMWN
jgi:hypothetical protein